MPRTSLLPVECGACGVRVRLQESERGTPQSRGLNQLALTRNPGIKAAITVVTYAQPHGTTITATNIISCPCTSRPIMTLALALQSTQGAWTVRTGLLCCCVYFNGLSCACFKDSGQIQGSLA